MSTDEMCADGLERLNLLASALSGSAVGVAPAGPGEATWTDGKTIFVDADAGTRDQLDGLAVQASLLAAGSLAPDTMRKLARRAVAAGRYLAVEGHRALAANEDLLPPAVRPLIDCNVAAASNSPEDSLTAALGREVIPDPPDVFGTIRARILLSKRAETSNASISQHISRRQTDQALAELEEDENDPADLHDPFSSPIGSKGAIGRLFHKLLGVLRRFSGGGPPGADAPTHRTRSGAPGGAGVAFSTALSGTIDEDTGDEHGTKYPEWDMHRGRYRPEWCTVQEVEPRPKDDGSLGFSDRYGLRRPLTRLSLGLDRCHRQRQGDDIDVDAAVETRVQVMAGSAPDEAVYLNSIRRRRDLAVMILLDISGSAAEPGAGGQTVHEQQRMAAAALSAALHALGDRVALYAFHSQGRSAVQVMPVKRFDDALDALVMRRLHGLTPRGYSRLGAAIRHGAVVLERRGATSRRLLVVVSDGLAYDHGYERVYGAADARRALAEARPRGIGCLCLTIGASTDAEELRRVFGSAAHATIPRLEQMRPVIGPLFRSAIRGAEVRRRAPH